MALTLELSTIARNAAANAVVDLIDGGSGAGYLEIRTGAQPADPQTAASGTLLGTLTFSDPAFGNAATGVATANAITGETSADATGTAAWFRAYDSANAAIFDGSVGTSGADLNLNSVSIVAGGTVDITSMTYTQPANA